MFKDGVKTTYLNLWISGKLNSLFRVTVNNTCYFCTINCVFSKKVTTHFYNLLRNNNTLCRKQKIKINVAYRNISQCNLAYVDIIRIGIRIAALKLCFYYSGVIVLYWKTLTLAERYLTFDIRAEAYLRRKRGSRSLYLFTFVTWTLINIGYPYDYLIFTILVNNRAHCTIFLSINEPTAFREKSWGTGCLREKTDRLGHSNQLQTKFSYIMWLCR